MPSTAPTPIYHFKILVPAAVAGRIIGKGGTTIAQLQRDAGARVKMSKASEFYPGTTERVCLISGPMSGIMKIKDFLMDNLSSLAFKILVPNSTAGMIIGKGGSYIKQIKEESGAYVQISQKSFDLSMPERCVTVIGELENIRKACAMILGKIVEDVPGGSSLDTSATTQNNLNLSLTHQPTITNHNHNGVTSTTTTTTTTTNNHNTSTNININTSNTNNTLNHGHHHSLLTSAQRAVSLSPIKNCSTAGSQLISHSSSLSFSPLVRQLCSTPTQQQPQPQSQQHHQQQQQISTQLNNNLSNHQIDMQPQKQDQLVQEQQQQQQQQQEQQQQQQQPETLNLTNIIEGVKLVLRVSGYGEDAVTEVNSAMSILANYGVLGIGLGL